MQHLDNSPLRPQAFSIGGDFRMKVMNYVGLAFAITAFGAYVAPMIISLTLPTIATIFILEIVLAFTSPWWSRWAQPINILIFAFFAFLSGLTLYPLLHYAIAVGGIELVVRALVITVALAFASGLWARTTNRDLSGWGGFLMMGLIGMIIVGILQIFFYSTMVEIIASSFGVVLFSAFIAYEIQMLDEYPKDSPIEAALDLYLSIFNLFISVLRLLGALRE